MNLVFIQGHQSPAIIPTNAHLFIVDINVDEITFYYIDGMSLLFRVTGIKISIILMVGTEIECLWRVYLNTIP